MEQQLYRISLLLAGTVNLLMAVSIISNNVYYRYYRIYQRSCCLTAVSLAIFGAGFLLHCYFGWRFSWPEAATALSVTYFHIGGMMLSWSHTSLLTPTYLSRSVFCRDSLSLLLCQVLVWTGAMLHSALVLYIGVLVFLVHVSIMSIDFLRTYHSVSQRLVEMKSANIREFVRWMLLSCYLIIGFGLGSIVFTALLPTAIWPYTVLLGFGIAVFVYIFYSITEYGVVIDSLTNATEDAAMDVK